MSISREELTKVAELARLSLSENEIEKYNKELNAILSHVNSLSEVQTDNVQPLLSAVSSDFVLNRPDLEHIANSSINDFRQEFQSVAPEMEGNFFKVPTMSAK